MQIRLLLHCSSTCVAVAEVAIHAPYNSMLRMWTAAVRRVDIHLAHERLSICLTRGHAEDLVAR